jgi:hypothetical protein
VTDTKVCARCREDLPFDRFSNDPRMALGKKSYCRRCQSDWAKAKYHADPEAARAKSRERAARVRTPERSRRRALQAMYGLGWDEYEAMLASQGGRCAVCGASEAGGRGNWHVDHDHESGRVRGLLCAGCNVGIGQFRDDPERLRAAARYLDRWAS